MFRRLTLLAAIAAGVSHAQLPDFRIQGVTATQAVVGYTAPDTQSCRVELSESPSYSPPVHDVNPALFTGANQDIQRPNTINSPQRSRVLVLGLRTAETAVDGKRYSRALQAFTTHYLRLTCGSIVQTATFKTTNIALGMTYNDPAPPAADRAGDYAWPTLDWLDRSQRIVDPLTGLQIRRLSMPSDVTSTVFPQRFAETRDLAGSWQQSGAVTADDTQSASTTSGGDWLFLDAALTLYLGGTHDVTGVSVQSIPVVLNAWCDNCQSAADRTLEACLSVDGLTCASKTLEATLEACTSGCNAARYRITIGAGGPPVVTAWGLENTDITDLHRRTGSGRRLGNRMLWSSGNRFNIHWRAGSRINLNGRSYSIASVENESAMTLDGADSNNELVNFVGSNFGVMVRKKSTASAAARLYVQYASLTYVIGEAPVWDAGGDGVAFTNCAPVQTPGPTGDSGWHCLVGGGLYWIGVESGDVIPIGRPTLPTRAGVDGWGAEGGGYCSNQNGGGPLWDQDDPNVFYCGQIDSTGGVSVVRARYRGNNTDVGEWDLSNKLAECSATRPEPCWEFTNLTPVSRSMNINQQLQRLYPEEYKLVRGATFNLVGYQGKKLQVMGRVDNAANDALGFLGLFDPIKALVVAASPSWKYWPLRWTVLHGLESGDDPNWMTVPATYFRGVAIGRDAFIGYGPYQSRVTSGPISTTPATCPPRPANSLIPPHEWPTGNLCVNLTVDGEPGDPTPAFYDVGTISSGAAGAITGTGVNWQPIHNKSQLRAGGKWYDFEYLTATTGRITPVPDTPLRNERYEIYMEPVNNPKTGNPLHAYLMDAEVRDIFSLSDSPEPQSFFFATEYLRLLIKDGNRWTLQRGYWLVRPEPAPMLAVGANAYLTAVPPSCQLGPLYPCAGAGAAWNTTIDPLGRNQSGVSFLVDRKNRGVGHGTTGPGANIASVADSCVPVDGVELTCYAVSPGEFYPDRAASEVHTVSDNPPFDGRVGVGSPNAVDSHPSFSQHREATPAADKVWFTDARPFVGSPFTTGSGLDPAVEVESGLWKFRGDQLARFRPKYMPTLASCGPHPLRDISGPGSLIESPTANAKGMYSYCYSRADGECREGSQTGELYVNCPLISQPYCYWAGVAKPVSDVRDICVMDNGAHTQGIAQLRYTEQEADGRASRVLTNGFSQYRFNDLFWNVKTTPDGKWLLFRSQWVNGKRTDAFLAKLPPFQPVDDQMRNGYMLQQMTVQAAELEGQDSVAIEFGYNLAFECTSRHESCIAGAPGGTEPFYYSTTEKWTPVACKDGCTVQVPAIPQRVLFYRTKYFDADGKQIGASGVNAWAFQ